MTIKLLLCALTICWTHIIEGQTLSPSTLTTTGSSFTGNGYQLDFTLGATFTSTLTNNEKILTQGFQQPELQLWTGTIATPNCPGSSISVPYLASGIISSSNIFTAQLSDASGSFANPVTIASKQGNTNGTLAATIPLNSPAGNQYKIRIKSSLPAFTAPDNGANITINPPVFVSVATAYALPKGVDAFTVYRGYLPAEKLKLAALATGGTESFSYKWSTGEPTASIEVSPLNNTSYVVTVTDKVGCSAAFTQTVFVEDVRCGSDMDKVLVCKPEKNKRSKTMCEESKKVSKDLSNGFTLGACKGNQARMAEAPITRAEMQIQVLPNPSSSYFTLVLKSDLQTPATINIIDISGKILERYSGISPNNSLKVGKSLKGGVYIASIQRGNELKTVKLIKIN